MGSRRTLFLAALLVASPLLAVPSAQERSAPAGPMVVRSVQVRDVRVVNQPAAPRHEERPSFGGERPVDPGFISRPVPRPQAAVNPPHRGKRNARGRKSFDDFKPRFNSGLGVIGYPVIYPYAYPYDNPFSPSSVTSYTPPAPPRNTYSNVATSSSDQRR